MNEKETAKQRLVDVTIELICQGKKPSEITVADITERAGVGNGMVNYHFQSKDNLMREAVKKVMICAKKHLSTKIQSCENATAAERLSIILKMTMDSFVENPEICRIAILDNLENDNETAHILSNVDVFNDCMLELYSNDLHQRKLGNYIIAGFLNFVLLKSEIMKKEMAFDLYDKIQRDNAIDDLVKNLSDRCEN